MSKIRVSCYIDGFNVYHAIDEASRAARGALNHLKWVDLRALMTQFTDPSVHDVDSVKLFTAYPTWHQARHARHLEFVKAQTFFGVETVIGQFKLKWPKCKVCQSTYKAREEKESDVNLASHLIADAYLDKFDQAFLVTNDSDLLGPLRMVRDNLPKKRVKIIAPPFRKHSKELWGAATHRTQIQQVHLEAGGCVARTRPHKFDYRDGGACGSEQ
jgi:uncharacterized LabA/DUF88 family protein